MTQLAGIARESGGIGREMPVPGAILLTFAAPKAHIGLMKTNTLEKPRAAEPESRRKRACLSCHTTFDSAWAGERVCPRCKGSTKWRSGAGMDVRRS